MLIFICILSYFLRQKSFITIIYPCFRYNCEDPNCYFDLARLKGVKYITWTDNEKLKLVEDVSLPTECIFTLLFFKFSRVPIQEEHMQNLPTIFSTLKNL